MNRLNVLFVAIGRSRASLFLVLAMQLSLVAVLQSFHWAKPTIHLSEKEIGGVPVHVAIIAMRGRPLAEHEEPLPPQAEVRIGSTRFRHPNELRGGEIIAGRYLVTTRDRMLTFTDMTMGRRFRTLDTGFEDSVFSSLSMQVSPDGRWLLIRNSWPFDDVVARIWEIQSDSDGLLRPVADIRLPGGDAHGFFDQLIFSADSKKLFVTSD